MLKLGLTGNIGCGKSSVTNILKEEGYFIIDADLISREIYEYDDVLREMRESFPEAFEGERIDRKKLGQIVFNDSERLKRLNEISHKKIGEIISLRLEEFSEKSHIYRVAVLDAALLFETGFQCFVDKTVVVYCTVEEEIKRIMQRDLISREDALKRISKQMDQDEKVRLADYMIDNSSDFENLEKNVKKLIEEIKKWENESEAKKIEG